ncbi:hypothetical protein A1O1_08740 [Capronia coronata CBS 617.96]|uniref:L-ornithine N(5)-monooxygenase n=1 Tax=Capronia coronata CBS 617.96 TaxID=1182541 RepID=W9XR79_9EURO|nr:uncharacterized protein A1O1_08740 [Capronia coronata CBS 617.96]EXJ79476.1 hypothetical protein A1O1_08740 [Capronia coronata CBS 617.96]
MSFDLVCVGFGVTALSLAITLHERGALDNTLFLESQPASKWNPCSSSAGGRMRTSFLNDLITSENPRSRFTFLKYLHATNRLALYANSSQIQPSREMFADYLRWCSASFQNNVNFGKRVTAIFPVREDQQPVRSWNVVFSDSVTGQQDSVTTKQVICAAGLQPFIPAPLSSIMDTSPDVVHATDCLQRISSTMRTTGGKCHFAIIGDGQTAADVFDHIHGIRGDHQVTWFTQDPVLRGTDDSPFIMDNTRKPSSKVGQALPLELRRRAIGDGLCTDSVSAIDRHLLMSIYEVQYAQSVKESDANKWKFQVKFQHKLVGAEKVANGKVRLSFQRPEFEEQLFGCNIFDLVIAATGYERTEYKKILAPLLGMLDGHQVTVNRDYQVNFRTGSCGVGCGLWLQGALEGEDVSFRSFNLLAC